MTSNPSHHDNDSEPKLTHMGYEVLLKKVKELRGIDFSVEEYRKIFHNNLDNKATPEEQELFEIINEVTIEIMVGKMDELEADEQAEDILRDALK